MNLCEEMFLNMNLALDGEISEEDRRQLDAHCATCPHCAQLYSQLKEMQESIVNLDDLAPSEGFKDRVLAQIATETKSKKAVSFPRQWKNVAAVAACAVLCFGMVQGKILPAFGSSMGAADSAATAPESVTYTTTAGAEDMGVSNQMSARDFSEDEMKDSAVADIPVAYTDTESDTAPSLTLSEQVAQDLGVDSIRWMMMDTSDMPESFPEGVPQTEDWTELPSGAHYCVLEEELWQQTRELRGYDRSENLDDDQQTFVLILVTK